LRGPEHRSELASEERTAAPPRNCRCSHHAVRELPPTPCARPLDGWDTAGHARRVRWTPQVILAGAAVCLLALTGWVAALVVDSRTDATAATPGTPTAPGTPTSPGTPAAPGGTSANPRVTPSPTLSTRRVFPVPGRASYGRTHHGYPATDIMAPCGAAYLAPYSGVVHEVNRVDRYDPGANDGATRGGLSLALLGDDGVRYYGSHFQAIDDTVTPGARVNAGDRLATVGRTGDASACHVHFGLSPVCGDGDWFVRRGVIWPWRYLDSWRAGGDAKPRPEIQRWLGSNGCPERPQVEP
jgi:murein DD-endopeptidase MepM/ murein hydrolase activator NlpD